MHIIVLSRQTIDRCGSDNQWFRVLAWLIAFAVVTIGPSRHRPHFDLGQIAEHVLAFGLGGVAFAIAYPLHRRFAAAITLVAGALELIQLFRPGATCSPPGLRRRRATPIGLRLR